MMKKLPLFMILICLVFGGCSQTADSGETQTKPEEETGEEVKEDKEENTQEQETPAGGEQSQEPQETALTVESLIQNPSAYADTYVHVRGNFPQAPAGMDENGEWILTLNGVDDLNQSIRIVDFVPTDGSCQVEAFGKVVYLDSGEPALSLDGYTVRPQNPEKTVLTLECLIQDPAPYVNSYVYVHGNLPQAPAGQDENGEWILLLNGAHDLDQNIRMINFTPTDGACPVEAYGTLVYMDNGDLALSTDGYNILKH